jgi:hypothetical protein
METEIEEIELHIIADPVQRSISFAPAPGVMQKMRYRAMEEVKDALEDMIEGKDNVVILGEPRM